MSHSKVYFLILSLTFFITSIELTADSRFRYLAPLSTNLKQQHDFQNSNEPKSSDPDDDFIYRKREIPEKLKDNYKFVVEFSKSAAERLRESKLKMKQIEREVLKRKLEGERELKKIMDQIDREQRKYIVEIERKQKRHREEMERAYRKQRKEMEED